MGARPGRGARTRTGSRTRNGAKRVPNGWGRAEGNPCGAPGLGYASVKGETEAKGNAVTTEGKGGNRQTVSQAVGATAREACGLQGAQGASLDAPLTSPAHRAGPQAAAPPPGVCRWRQLGAGQAGELSPIAGVRVVSEDPRSFALVVTMPMVTMDLRRRRRPVTKPRLVTGKARIAAGAGRTLSPSPSMFSEARPYPLPGYGVAAARPGLPPRPLPANPARWPGCGAAWPSMQQAKAQA